MAVNVTYIKPQGKQGSGGIRRLRLPETGQRITQITTFCPNKVGPGSTHVYFIEDKIPVLLDAGMPTHIAKLLFYPWRFQEAPKHVQRLPSDLSERELVKGLKTAGYAIEDIRTLVISHGHPDHFLMGRRILDKSGARVAAHILDTPAVCNPWSPISNWLCRQQKSAAMGMPPALPGSNSVPELVSQTFGSWMEHRLSFDVHDPILTDGPLVSGGVVSDHIQTLHLPGHSPGSIGLLVGGREKVLLCGDTLLSPITPIPDNLFTYLRTLEKLKTLRGVAWVMPAHGKAFRHLEKRVQQLQQHHRRRLRKCYQACKTPNSVWAIATTKGMFDVPVDPKSFNLLAGMETLAHLELLMLDGDVFRYHTRCGVNYYQNRGRPFDSVYNSIAKRIRDGSTPLLTRC